MAAPIEGDFLEWVPADRRHANTDHGSDFTELTSNNKTDIT